MAEPGDTEQQQPSAHARSDGHDAAVVQVGDPQHAHLPYRLVDRDWAGWLHLGSGVYQHREERLEHAQLEAQRGPLRPVLPITEQDSEQLAALLEQAGQKAAASLLAALHRASLANPHKLRSGRPGSWESESLHSLAWSLGCDLDERPHRIHEPTVAGIAAMLGRWANDPARYTETAETLARAFGRHTDQAGGWTKVADRYLRPTRAIGCPAPEIMEQVVGYLLSTSKHHEQIMDAFQALITV